MLQYGCGSLIINEKHEVLLLLRGQNSRNDINLWSQPGGAIDNDDISEENIIKNIKREVYEETSLDVEVIHFLCTTDHQDHETNWHSYTYLSKIVNGSPTLKEPEKHKALEWFNIKHLPQNLNQVTKDAVAIYLNTLQNELL